MHLLTTILYAQIELTWDRPLPGPAAVRARQLRGALANRFRDDDLFHQYDAAGRPLYRYPRIHYRWGAGRGIVAGWDQAAGRLLALPWLDLYLTLGDDSAHVDQALLASQPVAFGISERLLHYRLRSPALIFNQANYPLYTAMDANAQRRERDRLLVAQLLTALRGLGVNFTERLQAAFTDCSTLTCRYKQQSLLGLTGGFLANALLPPGFALGHAVSHGYGWIECEENDPWN
jgi:hypothetical protein